MMKLKTEELPFFDAAMIAAMQGIIENDEFVNEKREFVHANYERISTEAAGIALALTAKRREVINEMEGPKG